MQQGSTGGADADAELLRDDPPRGAGHSERGHLLGVHHNTRVPQLFYLSTGRVAGKPGVNRHDCRWVMINALVARFSDVAKSTSRSSTFHTCWWANGKEQGLGNSYPESLGTPVNPRLPPPKIPVNDSSAGSGGASQHPYGAQLFNDLCSPDCATLHPGLFSSTPSGSGEQQATKAPFSFLVVSRRIMDDYFLCLPTEGMRRPPAYSVNREGKWE